MLQIRLFVNDTGIGTFYVDAIEVKECIREHSVTGANIKEQYVNLCCNGFSIFTALVNRCVYESIYEDKLEYCKNLYLYDH